MSSRGGRDNSLLSKDATSQPPSPPLGPLLETLRTKEPIDSVGFDENHAVIKACEDVASYNWLDKKEPSILIPGEL